MEKIKFNDNLDMIWFHDEVYETVDCIDFNDFWIWCMKILM